MKIDYLISGYDFKLIQKYFGLTNKAIGTSLCKSEASIRNIHKQRYVRPAQMNVLFEMANLSEYSYSEYNKLITFIQDTLEGEGKDVRITEQMINLPFLFCKEKNEWLTLEKVLPLCNESYGTINSKTLQRMLNEAEYLESKTEEGIIYYRLKPEHYDGKQHRFTSDSMNKKLGADICNKNPEYFETKAKQLFTPPLF
jgi:hypothetical protein